MNIVLFGAPGCGKGSQAVRISAKYGLTHISTGDLFRYHISNKTPLGVIAKQHIDKGNLVPDELTLQLVEERLKEKDCENGFILDGFPRNIAQAVALEKFANIDLVVYIDVPLEEIEKRAVNRRLCPACGKIFSMLEKQTSVCDVCGVELIQRADDTSEVVRSRINNYKTQSEPVINYYKEKELLKTVRSGKSADETFVLVDELLTAQSGKKGTK